MDKQIICMNAEILWHTLREQRNWTYEEFQAASGLTDWDLNAAIGWLAKENKIEFGREYNKGTYFILFNVCNI